MIRAPQNPKLFLKGLIACMFLTLLAACDLATDWAPAISTVQEIRELEPSQTGVRAIAISDAELLAIGEHLPKLEYILINGDSKITDAGLASLSHLEYLMQVVICDGSRLTDQGIATLASVPTLSKLHIYNGTSLTDETLDVLGALRALRFLSLEGCPQVQLRTVVRLRDRRPECEIHFN
ncbi:MAG: hypothetical protein P1V35_15675 [Planctomycetota bacterium]|nr:hypothetical protein [Planctomycetota bacterium]